MKGKIAIIGGSFDETTGKPSGLVRKLALMFAAPTPIVIEGADFEAAEEIFVLNGGSYDDLDKVIAKCHEFNVILWMPSIPNYRKKLLSEIKQRNPTCTLIISKNNVENKYDLLELCKRQLNAHANLLIEFHYGERTGIYSQRLLDPLGNCFLDYDSDLYHLFKALTKRITELQDVIRIPTRQSKLDTFEIPYNEVDGVRTVERRIPPIVKQNVDIVVPEQPEFFELIKEHSVIYKKLIYGDTPTERFLGNASFRCCKGGFPSFAMGDLIFVSRRNIDKEDISSKGFVPVNRDFSIDGNEKEGYDTYLSYYGNHKPSVDAPIQVTLYAVYVKAKYMLHSHVYIKDAPFTERPLPCGAWQEIAEIVKANKTYKHVNFCVNLKGHGSIIIADNVDYMRSVEYVAREYPEPQYKRELMSNTDILSKPVL